MLSVDILRELWEGVVTSHKDGITFFSRWSDVLDTGNDEHHPKVLWKPPTVALVPNGYGCDQTFTVDLIFLDNTASDRDSDTRDGTYERMTILAAQCLLRFRELYVEEDAIYQGVNLSITQSSPAQVEAIWDEAGHHTTGCRMVVTFTDVFRFCSSDYFA
jgi:hypothetical protein